MLFPVLRSADRVLGLLAQTLGNLDQATAHFEDAPTSPSGSSLYDFAALAFHSLIRSAISLVSRVSLCPARPLVERTNSSLK